MTTDTTARKHTPAEYVEQARELARYKEGVKEAAHAIKYETSPRDMIENRAHYAADSCEEVIRRRDNDPYSRPGDGPDPYTAAIKAAMLEDAEAKAAKTKTPAIKRSPDPNRITYTQLDTIDTETLGTVHLRTYAEHVPGTRNSHGYGEPKYTVAAYVDDSLTIHNRTYTKVQATSDAHGAQLFGRIWASTGRYDDTLTDIARAVIGQALAPIIHQYIEQQGGPEAVKKRARNEVRRSEAASEQREADRHATRAAEILQTIEP